MTELSLTPEDIARQIRLLVEQLYGKGRKDLLLHAVGVPYYMATAKQMDKQKVMESVDHLTDPLDNAINEKCSRIKKVFLDMMDEYTASYYIISSHTQKHIVGSNRTWYQRLKIIALPRYLVCNMNTK